MFFFEWFHSFLPLRNPIGFGVSDFLELALATLLVLFALIWNPVARRSVLRRAERTRTCVLLLFLLPIVLRLLLLPNHPVPTPDIYDEFSHLLVADTLLHFRLANPPHALHRFFETFFELQQPTYASIYPPGQGILLAFGRIVSRVPWTGVLLCTGAFSALCYWMLRAWTKPGWALLGGIFAVIEFGPLNSWTNSYWGGTLPAAAGCLVFGSLPRIRTTPLRRYAALLGLGLGMHFLTRPFESIMLGFSVLLYFGPELIGVEERRKLAPLGVIALLAFAPALLLTLMQNKSVTQQWFTLPYQLSQYQYGVPATLTFQRNAVPHLPLTPQQALDYKAQALTHGEPDTISRFFVRLVYRIRYYRFFFLPPLYLVLLAFLFALREQRLVWVAATIVLFALGTNLFPYLLPRYLAALTCLFILVSVKGLEVLSRLELRNFGVGAEAARMLVFLCLAHFAFWYTIHLFESESISMPLMQYETWDDINHLNPQRRIQVNHQLATIPGKLLVFVRYYPQHPFQDEWVWNAAEIDAARIVWARELGTAENEQLLRYYPDRKPLLLEPDFRPPRLSSYH